MAELGPFRILVDGHCPVCRREGDLLQWLDRGRGRLAILDISHPDFDPSRLGLTREEVMREIHGLTWDGRILRGMEVFREAHDRLGLGFLSDWTGWPVMRPLADAAYKVFSEHRYLLSGGSHSCPSGACRPR